MEDWEGEIVGGGEPWRVRVMDCSSFSSSSVRVKFRWEGATLWRDIVGELECNELFYFDQRANNHLHLTALIQCKVWGTKSRRVICTFLSRGMFSAVDVQIREAVSSVQIREAVSSVQIREAVSS